ncbi:C1 family peptidase [Sinomicrobium soli]|uniref:C1 family peptidase n=1 Tax=Sinomicrobium sp. N-1-3-6 TaxID=2219864 RepID=UPI000DCC822D|nr:C1 family peptidase [Sinomicrobium sp. N-1-3-6]RAV28682.1 aminopeptidase [Sinomicrobium sp. N-1-3-6]
MKKFLLCLGCLCSATLAFSQQYSFNSVIDLEATPVISQDITGTCWSFSTSSFLESEIIRISGKQIDISEMYNVRNTYPEKAWNYVMRQGKAQFSQGGLAHDVINSAAEYGLVPHQVYTGLSDGQEKHNHTEMVSVLEGMLNVYIENPARTLSPKWKDAVESVLDVYLGKRVDTFTFDGKEYSPESFMKMTGIAPENYITVTSFTHRPFYSAFVLNIPDNFSDGSFYNLPLDEFIQVIDHALEEGYTLALDCDVSEPGFSQKHGVAVVPENTADAPAILSEIKPEKAVSPEYRQQEFENFHTTDDHLMHITGKATDQNGNTYYKVKNSWGTDQNRVGDTGGYIYMSVPYMRLKAISVMLHKEALSGSTAGHLGI